MSNKTAGKYTYFCAGPLGMPAFAKNFVHFETTMMIKIHVMS